jgi:flagellar export protein FliJ
MTFRFSLEPVLKVNEHREKVQQQKYADQVKAAQDIKTKITDLNNQLLNAKDEEAGTSLANVHAFRTRIGMIEQAHQQIHHLRNDLVKVDEKVKVERQKLVEAHRKTHMMETIKGKEFTAFRQFVDKVEQVQMDEVASQIVSRR